MNRYLLLILLSSWAHVVPLSLQCETGVAYPKHVLSIPRSLMANADVGVLKTYKADTLDKCITDCCTEKFGLCSVASFKKGNDTEENCQHFNCRPVNKCKFLSSNSTDSFSFSSSSSSTPTLVPSSHASENVSLSTVPTVTTSEPKLEKFVQNSSEHAVTNETIATYSETFSLKDDNTTIKPRKGIYDITESPFENVSRSGVKPRKGVSLDGLTTSNNSKSKVKPRKGVGPFQSQSLTPSEITVESSVHKVDFTPSIVPDPTSSSSIYKDTIADDIVSALEKVFEDDSTVHHVKSSTISPVQTTAKGSETSATVVSSFIPTSTSSMYTSISSEKASSTLQSSLTTSYIISSSMRTPDLVTPSMQTTEILGQYFQPSSSRPSIFEHSKLLFHESGATNVAKSVEEERSDSEESENERKYKSSMHIVLSLIFGLLVLFSVLGVIAKRIYDGWLRRHYRRMDFLIDGMYNGYG